MDGVASSSSSSSSATAASSEKRKRGRPRRQAVAPPPPKRQALKRLEEEEDVWEDVCFICFDGGSLVLCDRKGCPKAYHTTCIKRDEAYFRSEGEWYCGWHICSVCQRAAHYMCYTCTYALCKGCTKDTDFVCVRRNMGLCTTCMKTIMLIENKDQENKELIQVDFDDKTSWEYLFKVYWIHLKQSISLTLHELIQAKNLSKGVGYVACNQKLHGPCSGVNYGNGLITNGNCEQVNLQYPKDLEQSPSSGRIAANDASVIRCKDWASKKLLDFVAHVKNGDTSVLSQFEVQGLLLEYIKKNSLLDRDCQVICDLRLTNLFGKPQVSQSEMLKLLECHFLMKEDLQNSSTPAGNVETPLSHLEHRENKESLTRLQNSYKKFEVGVPQDNLDEYAAIDVHNMNLIFLPGNLMGSLTQDEKFHDKVVGSIVRIKISNSDQKQDMYRLVQVTGTNKVAEPYNLGNKTVDVVLEVLNLDKKESVAIDAISDQEFSPDECRHLREIIKCGLVKRLTVGEVRKKAMELLAVRLDERLDAEISKLNQICDQTSEKEQINELRQRITKLQLLKTPEEYQRRFSGILQVHTDPKMSPDYDSEQDAEGGDGQKPEVYLKCKSSEFGGTGYNSQREDPVKDEGLINGQHKVNKNRDGNDLSDQAVPRLGTENSAAVLETESSSPMNENETEKLWYYRDPNNKTQGPFSIVQLREWSTTGYFPPDMRIWTIYEHQDSILLTDALNGQFHTAAHLLYNLSLQSHHVRGSNQNSDAESNEHTEELSRDGNQIVETLKEGGTGVDKCRESNATGGSDVLGDSNGIQSRENNESGRIDVLDGTSGLQSRENHEYGKINDTGVQSRENNESGRSYVSGSESCGFTASGFCLKEMQPGNSSPCESKEHDSSSDHCQIGQLPSSTNGSSHVSPRQEGGRGSEGSRSSPNQEKLDSDGSAATQTVGQSHENKYHGKSTESQPMGQNRRSFPINLNSKDIDLNSGLSPATNSDSSKQSCEMELPELPSCTPKEGNREPKAEAAENSQLSLDVSCSGMPNPPSPMLKLSNESQIAQITEYKLPPSLKVEYQDLRPSRSSASSLVVGGAQFQNIANDWGGYPPPPFKPVLEGWSSGLVSSSSIKQHETAGISGSATANVEPLAHISTFNHTPNISSWHGIVEPIEFISLAEESVSDLLAEVDAMESQGGGFASPTSAMRCEDEMIKFCKNESFTIEDLSPTHNTGRSDAMSSTGDLQLPCQSTAMRELAGASEGDTYDPSKKSTRHSSNSRDREARFAEVRVNQRVAAHPGLSLTMSQDINSALPPSSMMEFMDSGIMGRAPEHMNYFRGAPSQGINNIAWATNQGTSWGNPNLSLGAHNANGGLQWDVQRKYAGERHPGPRDYENHGGGTGYGGGRISFNRPSFGGGGGYARSPKGQRVCKFYESGHCKKGASCGYLHP